MQKRTHWQVVYRKNCCILRLNNHSVETVESNAPAMCPGTQLIRQDRGAPGYVGVKES